MKSILLASAVILGFAGTAFAADAVVDEVVVVDTTYNWSGLYAGVHLGGGWSDYDFNNTVNTSGFGDLLPHDGFSISRGGFLGGGQLGYNWQSGNLIYGLEASLSAIDGSESWRNTGFGGRDDEFKAGIDTLLLATGRIGYAFDRTLVYANGGYAGANFKAKLSDTRPPTGGSGSAKTWASGFTVGTGVEYALTDKLRLGAQYNYAAFRDAKVSFENPGHYSFRADNLDMHIVSIRLNYSF